MMHIRKNGEKDQGHRVDFAFSNIDADQVIQLTLNGVEVAMPMREWHALAVQFATNGEAPRG